MEKLLGALIDGVAFGCVYALLAVGLTLAYKTSGVFNIAFGVQAFAWDVQEVRHLRAVLKMGIDGLYCDRPDRMVATVGEWVAGDRGDTSVTGSQSE